MLLAFAAIDPNKGRDLPTTQPCVSAAQENEGVGAQLLDKNGGHICCLSPVNFEISLASLAEPFASNLQKVYDLFVPRPSYVRDAVASLFAASERHGWSLDEVDRALRERGTMADPSSIFRALSYLERAGVIDRVELADGKARYELHQEHHEHIVCTRCRAIAPVPGCVLPEAQDVIAASTGYLVGGHKVLFEGLCPTCSKEAR